MLLAQSSVLGCFVAAGCGVDLERDDPVVSVVVSWFPQHTVSLIVEARLCGGSCLLSITFEGLSVL